MDRETLSQGLRGYVEQSGGKEAAYSVWSEDDEFHDKLGPDRFEVQVPVTISDRDAITKEWKAREDSERAIVYIARDEQGNPTHVGVEFRAILGDIHKDLRPFYIAGFADYIANLGNETDTRALPGLDDYFREFGIDPAISPSYKAIRSLGFLYPSTARQYDRSERQMRPDMTFGWVVSLEQLADVYWQTPADAPMYPEEIQALPADASERWEAFVSYAVTSAIEGTRILYQYLWQYFVWFDEEGKYEAAYELMRHAPDDGPYNKLDVGLSLLNGKFMEETTWYRERAKARMRETNSSLLKWLVDDPVNAERIVEIHIADPVLGDVDDGVVHTRIKTMSATMNEMNAWTEKSEKIYAYIVADKNAVRIDFSDFSGSGIIQDHWDEFYAGWEDFRRQNSIDGSIVDFVWSEIGMDPKDIARGSTANLRFGGVLLAQGTKQIQAGERLFSELERAYKFAYAYAEWFVELVKTRAQESNGLRF